MYILALNVSITLFEDIMLKERKISIFKDQNTYEKNHTNLSLYGTKYKREAT